MKRPWTKTTVMCRAKKLQFWSCLPRGDSHRGFVACQHAVCQNPVSLYRPCLSLMKSTFTQMTADGAIVHISIRSLTLEFTFNFIWRFLLGFVTIRIILLFNLSSVFFCSHIYQGWLQPHGFILKF